MKTHEKIAALRHLMAHHDIAALVVPGTDPHQSEYTPAHWQARSWLTGFDGSAGTAVITRDRALLWTDFRYWIQAAGQIAGSKFELLKSGEPGVKEFEEWLADVLAPGSVVAADGKLLSRARYRQLKTVFDENRIGLRWDLDLLSPVWQDRPPMPASRAWDFSVHYAGRSRADKLQGIRAAMEKQGADRHVMTVLEDIAWTFNLRGEDVPHNPVNIAFALVEMDGARLFMAPSKLSEDLAGLLEKDGIETEPYDALYPHLAGLPEDSRILLDPETVSQAIFSQISPACRIIEGPAPPAALKAVKNQTEIRHLRETLIKDGVAKTCFLHWMETSDAKGAVCELTAADKLFELRSRQDDFKDNSFAPIMAYGDHSAMCHYGATPDTTVPIQKTGMFLTDSGGNYLTGTTDITRTLCLGEPTPQQIKDYTLVLKGHIAVATARFPENTKGFQIDTLARQFLWREGMNFGHGTGHGVGFFLCVHEGPARISPLPVDVPLKTGMVLTNEPGIYREGTYGIRLENMILVQNAKETEFGRFLKFDTLTLCHFERDLVDKTVLTPGEAEWINAYHKRVYEMLSPRLEPDVAAWLKEKTRPI